MQPRKRVPPARHAQAISVEVEDSRSDPQGAGRQWLGPWPGHGAAQAARARCRCRPPRRWRGSSPSRDGGGQPRKRPGPPTSLRVRDGPRVLAVDAFSGPGRPEPVHDLQLLDDRSRYLLASHVAPGERAADACAWSARIERFQVPCLLLSDNGTAFNQTEWVVAASSSTTRGLGTHDHGAHQKGGRVYAERWLRKQRAPERAAAGRLDRIYTAAHIWAATSQVCRGRSLSRCHHTPDQPPPMLHETSTTEASSASRVDHARLATHRHPRHRLTSARPSTSSTPRHPHQHRHPHPRQGLLRQRTAARWRPTTQTSRLT